MNSLDDTLALKRDRLLQLLAECGRVAVAFSAGIDSTVVAKAAQLACGDNAVAVTGVSASLAAGELDEAEKFWRQEFGLRELRVRLEGHELARIEVSSHEIARFLEPAAREAVTAKLRELGFQFVTLDLDGFRSGSMNSVLPVESLRMH